jgi:hypothetical protein
MLARWRKRLPDQETKHLAMGAPIWLKSSASTMTRILSRIRWHPFCHVQTYERWHPCDNRVASPGIICAVNGIMFIFPGRAAGAWAGRRTGAPGASFEINVIIDGRGNADQA